MNRRIAVTAAIVATVGSCLLQTGAANAESVAWNLSIGGPGYGISVGQPGYWGGAPAYRGPRHHNTWRPWYGSGYTAVLPAPVIYPAPLAAPVGYLPPVVYPAPYAVAPVRPLPYYAPYRIVAPVPRWSPPPHRWHY
jgi:hypothetical protein